MTNPYADLPSRNFWRSAVGSLNPFDIGDLHRPKFAITGQDRFVTAGSCFAQHISRAIVAQGITWIDAEPAPPRMPPEDRLRFNYGIFSFRTSNIYTTAALRQWLEWATGRAEPPTDGDGIWEGDEGRFHDAFRPAIEPNGFASADELIRCRTRTLRAIATAVKQASVFVFTLGLTEAWSSARSGIVYAACPGTLAGTFDPEVHRFQNLDYMTTRENLQAAVEIMRDLNPDLKIILTVSPVPLTASAEDHVLVATTYSKSTLRAVAGDFAKTHDFIDYFPSYEIITAPAYRGIFFEPNMRSVNKHGVDHVMKQFLSSYGLTPADRRPSPPAAAVPEPEPTTDDELVCEEAILEFYNKAGQ